MFYKSIKMMSWLKSILPLIIFGNCIFVVSCTGLKNEDSASSGIKPYTENPYYWQYNGKPVLLLGGTDQDNLFNHPQSLEPNGLESHLDLLVAAGGNYVRNTMSHRDNPNEFAYYSGEDAKFDLNRWNEEYWKRFSDFLRMTADKGIIVQIEIWETWDIYLDHEPQGGWSKHPFNPQNNINYDIDAAGLPEKVDFYPLSEPTGHSFFHTVPALENNELILSYQEAFVDKILSYTFNYDHILYCMNNETGEPPQWGEYWVNYISDKARTSNKAVEITDMRRSEDLSSSDHRYIQNDPDSYTFIEVSQNNGHGRTGQDHWDPLMMVRDYIADAPRPINNVKIYGGGGVGSESVDQGVQKFWRNIFAGCASARFHRRFPATGIGLNELAQANLRSARMLTDAMDIFSAAPMNELLSDREDNEAYLMAEPGSQYALYFPNGGEVILQTVQPKEKYRLKWMDIKNSFWSEETIIQGGSNVEISTPSSGHWAALLLPI